MKNWSAKDTKIERKLTIRIGGQILDLANPLIMGIINVTPDSFYDGGSSENDSDALAKADKMILQGADVLDLGAQSTRPKAEQIGPDEEWKRLKSPLSKIREAYPNVLISVDTYHHAVAEKAVAAGADIINDIGGGTLDPQMWETIGKLKIPYILMHIQGTPENMQINPEYQSIVEDLSLDLSAKIQGAIDAGIDDIIVDPGFGFGKTVEHNYELLNNFDYLKELGHPLLAGVSRKSMIWKTLETSATQALNGTSALHMALLMKGANILRAHDVKEAVEVRTLWQSMQKANSSLHA